MKKELFRMENGKKDSAPFGALEGLHMSLLEGEMMGLIFSSLHEKATFVRLFREGLPLTYGRIYLDEDVVKDHKRLRDRVHVIDRSSDLMENMSIWENVYFHDLPLALLHKRAYKERLRGIMAALGIEIAIEKSIARLTHAEKIMLELVKAYALKRKVILFSDMSYYLTEAEMEEVFGPMLQMKALGYGFLFIDSLWSVMRKYADRIAIIKGGRTQGFFDSWTLSEEKINAILWQDTAREALPNGRVFKRNGFNDVALEFEHVDSGMLQDVSLKLERGKCLRLFFQDERHSDDFAALLRGDAAPLRGNIYVAGKALPAKGAWMAQKLGLCFTGENPQESMLVDSMSVMDNLGFLLSKKSRMLWLRRDYQRNLRATMEEICGEDLWNIPIRELTPMQAQKLTYARWILFNPAVVVCLKPFTGMDYRVDNVTEIMLGKLLERGISALLLSSYLPMGTLEAESMYL